MKLSYELVVDGKKQVFFSITLASSMAPCVAVVWPIVIQKSLQKYIIIIADGLHTNEFDDSQTFLMNWSSIERKTYSSASYCLLAWQQKFLSYVLNDTVR